MKKKILSFFLAAVLCFCGFFASVPVVASAISVGGWIDIAVAVMEITEFFVDRENEYKTDLAYNSNYAIGVRSEILARFNNLAPGFAISFSRDDFDDLLEAWSTDPSGSIIAEQFGNEVGSYCALHQEEYKEFEKMYLMRFFRGRSDFVNQLYDTDLSGYKVTDNGNVQIPSDALKENLISQNYLYTPKSSGTFKFGYRSVKYLADVDSAYGPALRFYNKDYGFCEQGYSDLWFVPYLLTESGELMLARYQYRIYIDNWQPQNTDTVTDLNRYCIRVETYSYVEGLEGVLLDNSATIAKSPELSGLPKYLLLTPFYSSSVPFAFYKSKSLSDYLSGYSDTTVMDYVYAPSDGCDYYSSDLQSYIDVGPYSEPWKSTYLTNFKKTYAENPLKNIDVGFLCSGSQIRFKYDFDIDRLPSNTTITISGDSVYDYSITDNSTGDTTTITEYVTNNYAFPDNTGGNGGSGGGGSFDGKIEVGGKVEVDGKVDVDVNVNVNGVNGGVVGGGTDYESPDLDPINGYLDDALEESSGFRQFLKTFFDFLPPEILILLGVGLSVVILARILGR